MKSILLSLFMSFFLIGCGVLNFSEAGFDESTQSVASAFSTLDQMSSGIQTATRSVSSLVDGLRPPQKRSCLAGSFGVCEGGGSRSRYRERTVDCTTAGGAEWAGTIRLDFTGNNCRMDQLEETLTRTLPSNLTVTATRGTITVSTDSKTTWDGTEVGGGQRLTLTDLDTRANTFSYEVLGVTRSAKTAADVELFNISRHTPDGEAMTVTGTDRNNRTVTGGKLQVFHNLLAYTAEWVPTDVTWEETCTCPVSGSVAGTLTGSQTGSLNVTFNSCGTATVTRDGESQQVTLDSCSSVE